MEQTVADNDERLTTVGLLFESSAGLRRVFQRRLESERSLSSQSFDVMIRLARTPGSELRMSELAAQASLTPSGLTRSVDRLQEQGLVVRRVCPEDRRGAFAVLTPVGQEIMDRAIPDHIAHIMGQSMEGLIHHFKLVTEGFRVPAGQAYVPIESPALWERSSMSIALSAAWKSFSASCHCASDCWMLARSRTRTYSCAS